MLFASDLDRTLIYSKQFIEDKIKLDRDLSLVEKFDDKEISFMTKTSINLLKELNEMILFVPVTTRTIEQYQRIVLFKNEIIPKYSIVSNGGNILEKGVLNKEWNERVKKELIRNCSNYTVVRKKFNEISDESWILREYMADGLFFYFIIDQEKIPYDRIYDFEIWLKENKWLLSMQERKLYLIPDCVDKWRAISFICEKENDDIVVAAGDSLLDLKMLNKANYAISPSHGEIKKRVIDTTKEQGNIRFTKHTGFYAAEDILLDIKHYISINK